MNSLKITFVISLLFISLTASAQDTFDLHAAFALTGVGASFGNAEVEGATLAIENFNQLDSIDGKKVRLNVEDTQSDNFHTLSAVRKLVSLNQAKIILGPTWLDSYQSVLPISDKNQVLLITPSAAIAVFKKQAKEYELAFSTWFNLEIEVQKLLSHVKRDGKNKLAIVFDQDPYFQAMRNLILKKAAALGIDIIADESFDFGTSNFRTTLLKMKSSKVEGVIFGFGNEENIFTFLKQRHEISPNLKLYGTDYIDGYVSQAQWFPLFENVDYIAANVNNQEFLSAYQKRFNHPPVLSASSSYDATAILLKALKSNKRTPTEIRKFLLNNEFDTVSFGKVRFDLFGGVNSSSFVIKRILGNKIIQLPSQ